MIDNATPQVGEVDDGEHKPKIENTLSQQARPVEGSITKQIGSGDYAKDTFIYMTIFWSFIIGSVTCGAIYIRSYAPPDMTSKELLEVIKGVWSIFLPIITLALGYAFGKGR